MNRLFSLIVLALSLALPVAAQAAEKSEAWTGFWEKLRMKIEQMTPQKKLGSTTAVGGVRGAAVEVGDVYWKGEAKPQIIDADELATFRKAMALIEADQKDEAKAAFTSFVKTYPASPLKADAELVLGRLTTAQ